MVKNCIVCGSKISIDKFTDNRFCNLQCELLYIYNKEAINNNRLYDTL